MDTLEGHFQEDYLPFNEEKKHLGSLLVEVYESMGCPANGEQGISWVEENIL